MRISFFPASSTFRMIFELCKVFKRMSRAPTFVTKIVSCNRERTYTVAQVGDLGNGRRDGAICRADLGWKNLCTTMEHPLVFFFDAAKWHIDASGALGASCRLLSKSRYSKSFFMRRLSISPKWILLLRGLWRRKTSQQILGREFPLFPSWPPISVGCAWHGTSSPQSKGNTLSSTNEFKFRQYPIVAGRNLG